MEVLCPVRVCMLWWGCGALIWTNTRCWCSYNVMVCVGTALKVFVARHDILGSVILAALWGLSLGTCVWQYGSVADNVCGSVALSGTDLCCTITGGSTFILRSLTADIIDYDRFRTGENREAQYVGCVVVPGHS